MRALALGAPLADVALTSFVTLFVIIDPIGLVPMFVALTGGLAVRERRAIAARACLTGFGILLVFGLAGEALLALIGIGMPAFRIAGGLLLFLTALDMLFEKRRPRREKSVEARATPADDPAIFPLATPLIAGPGAMATMILLVEQQPAVAGQAVVFSVMAAVVLSAYLLFQLAGLLERALGPLGINVVTRLLGMLLAALSVQFVLDGLRDVSAGWS